MIAQSTAIGHDLHEPFAHFDMLAKTRIAVAILNFPLAYLSYWNPNEPEWSVAPGFLGCGAFLVWMVASYGLHRRVRDSEFGNSALTLVDILSAALLVSLTGGAASPFGSWISFMALGTILVTRRRYAILIGLTAVAVILAIGAKGHIISSLTVVRASWATTFAFFGFLVRASLAKHLRLLGALESFTAEIGKVTDSAQAVEAFRRAVEAIAEPSNVVIRLQQIGLQTRPGLDVGTDWLRIPIASGAREFGEAHLARTRKFRSDERVAVQLAGERLASALLRLQTSSEMIDEAVRQERLALADELHDTTIQTLTALDLGATMLQRRVADDVEAWELAGEIADQARGHIGHVRRFLRESVNERVPGPEALLALLDERWSGRYEVDIERGIRLTEARWRLVGLMAREGLNNALRHGRATRVRLIVTTIQSGFEARLEADGESPPTDPRLGYGLQRLRAVAAAQHAEVELRGGERGGSVLAVHSSEERES